MGLRINVNNIFLVLKKNNQNVEVMVEGREEKRDHIVGLLLEMVPGWRE